MTLSCHLSNSLIGIAITALQRFNIFGVASQFSQGKKQLPAKSISSAFITICFLLLIPVFLKAQTKQVTITSPNRKIKLEVTIAKNGNAYYSITHFNRPVILQSRLGLITDADDYSSGLAIASSSPVVQVKDRYELFTGKKRNIQYVANKRSVRISNKNKKNFDVIFQVSNDGVAFRYSISSLNETIKVKEEVTSFRFDTSAKAFLQPMAIAKTGWEATNPSYEEHYQQNIKVGTPESTNTGWVYPALFNSKNTWVLVSEAGIDGNYCATRLKPASPNGEYSIGFPDAKEVMTEEGLLPQAKGLMSSPWRIITIGDLKTITESTLGTDVAPLAKNFDRTFIKPGKASWSWINSKDDFIIYEEQKKYIDFAAEMKWQYCLIDADWDRKIGYEKIQKLATYAATKKVDLLLWYNSAGSWNTVKYTPKDLLLTHESRMKEFSRLKSMGIKGVKIDFFGGDGRSVMQYYIDILNDAAASKLMVNFHGATLPRGWQKTYPNLVTVEAVRGFEMITFMQPDADLQATHCTMLSFTRNVFDPMDFTPMNLYKIQTPVARQTTSAFELALPVLFLSGIQHFAESPEGMSHMPGYVKTFLQDLPVRWDDVRFISGYPGRDIVMARRAGTKWYIAGINGEKKTKKMKVNLNSFGLSKMTLIADGEEPASFILEQGFVSKKGDKEIQVKPNGGFVIVLE